MAKCALCEDDIEDGQETTVHDPCKDKAVFHADCFEPIRDGNLKCPVCEPQTYAAAQAAPQPAVAGYGSADEGYGSADEGYVTADEGYGSADEGYGSADEGYVTADEGYGMEAAAYEPAVGPSVVTEAASPPAAAVPAATEADPAADLGRRRDEVAARLLNAVTRVMAAHQAASTAIEALTARGPGATLVTSTIEKMHPGFTAAVDGCGPGVTGPWQEYATNMPAYPASEDTNKEAGDSAAGYESNADVLERGRAVLSSMAVIDIGGGVADTLSAIGKANVADMALTGEGYSGNNLHKLTDSLKGWSSIRAEGGSVIIVRWSGTKWQVGATGKHIQTSNGYDYKLDDRLAAEFVPTLAWRDPGGKPALIGP